MNSFLNIRLNILFLACLCASFVSANNSAFQPFSAQGDNLMHVTTADFDGVGVKDFVVALTVSGKVIAFQRPDLIINPLADNRLWEFQPPTSMGIRIVADEVMDDSAGDEVILPGTDGNLRILSSKGDLLLEKKVSTGTVAEGNEPIWYLDYFASGLWWEMTPENCEVHAQGVYDAQQEWYDKIGGQVGYW
ncbi:MAG: hypothetical protein KAS71_14385 [Bacteroidales bacterium]|nr:hypothetical protein [Bacteroidales bacterium]